MKLISGGRIIFNKLIQNNVKNVWLYSGGAVMPLIDCFNNQKSINYYINTSEQNLGHSATGYAKSTGNTGVCIVTSGPGLTNLITPMLDAQNDSVPLVVLSGQVGLKSIGTNAFQEAPSVDLTKVFTKWSYCVKKTEDLPFILDKAFRISNEGKKGVVHIDLPKCILSNKIVESYLHSSKIKKLNVDSNYKLSKCNNNKKELIEIMSKIINSSKNQYYV